MVINEPTVKRRLKHPDDAVRTMAWQVFFTIGPETLLTPVTSPPLWVKTMMTCLQDVLIRMFSWLLTGCLKIHDQSSSAASSSRIHLHIEWKASPGFCPGEVDRALPAVSWTSGSSDV